jgi:polysaccharide export outer membrane protein
MLLNSMNSIGRPVALPLSLSTFFRYFLILISSCFYLISLFSCTSAKSVTYFTDLTDSLRVELPEIKKPEAIILPDDMLEIRIAGANEQTSSLFNNYGSNSVERAAITPIYLVDLNGYLEFPIIGKIKAAGMTRDEFKILLKQAVGKYLKDPIVTVRFTNFRFTVLGEVRSPGSFNVQNEKVSILEALGQAGDMTQFAKRNSVRVIRDSMGKREIGMVNFNQKTVFTSPYYYLKRNDVVYVEPQQSKTNYESVSRISSILATALGIVAVIFSLVR